MPLITHPQTGLMYRAWRCDAPKEVLLLVHGLGAQSARWESCAEFFLQQDIASYAVELRGFGRAPGKRGHIDSFQTYFHDILTLRAIIHHDYPDAAITVTGESLGGLLVFLLAAERPAFFKRLICLAPAFKSILPFSLSDHLRVAIALLTRPSRQLIVPFTAAMCTRDTAYQERMDNDENEHRLASKKRGQSGFTALAKMLDVIFW